MIFPSADRARQNGRLCGAFFVAASLFLLALPLDARAQEQSETDDSTRVSEWARAREAKAQRPAKPYAPSVFERSMRKADKGEIPNVYGWNVWGLYPRIQSIAAGSKTALGVRLWKPEIGGTGLDLHGSAFYSAAHYQYYDVQFGQIPHVGSALPLRASGGTDLYELGGRDEAQRTGLILYGSFVYRHYTQLPHYGSGPDSVADGQTVFLAEGPLAEIIGGYQFTPHLALRVRSGVLQPDLGESEDGPHPPTQDLFDEETAPGLTRQPDYVTASGQLFWDIRDIPGAPHSGALLSVEYGRFEDRNLDEFSFDRFAIDARGYIPLGSRQRVLALRAAGNFDEPDAGHRVPFYLQQSLGGPFSLRGYPSFRFRGEEVVLFQAEYRWEAGPALEFAAFVDAGAVSRLGENVDLGDLKTDWGFGVRLKNWRAVFLRFEVARGEEGTRFVFATSSVF